MAKYRKKPVIIEAFQMTIEARWDNSEWPDWAHQAWQHGAGEGGMWPSINHPLVEGKDSANEIATGTLEGVHVAGIDDWIIKGVKGEIYVCKPDIFDITYEAVEE